MSSSNSKQRRGNPGAPVAASGRAQQRFEFSSAPPPVAPSRAPPCGHFPPAAGRRLPIHRCCNLRHST
eukprot:tig00001265_g7898.t1